MTAVEREQIEAVLKHIKENPKDSAWESVVRSLNLDGSAYWPELIGEAFDKAFVPDPLVSREYCRANFYRMLRYRLRTEPTCAG